jgi:hypothetical protein
MTIEVHIVGRTDVIGVEVTDGGSAGDRIVLYDDGTHGDAAAGDNVFTNSSVQPYCNPDWLLSSHGGAKMWWGMLRVQLSDGREIGHNYGMTAGLVHPDFKEPPGWFIQTSKMSSTLSTLATVYQRRRMLSSSRMTRMRSSTAILSRNFSAEEETTKLF